MTSLAYQGGTPECNGPVLTLKSSHLALFSQRSSDRTEPELSSQ
jgi:hypothetical protein